MARNDALLTTVVEGFAALNARIDAVNTRIDAVNTRLDTVIDALADLRRDFDTHSHD